jgi:hypothetical protein
MKQFFIWLLVVMMVCVGNVSIILYATSGSGRWYNFVFIAFSMITCIPAIKWWDKYFNNLFKNNNQ